MLFKEKKPNEYTKGRRGKSISRQTRATAASLALGGNQGQLNQGCWARRGQGLGGATGEEAWHCTETRARVADSTGEAGQMLQSFPPGKASYSLNGLDRFLWSLPLYMPDFPLCRTS